MLYGALRDDVSVDQVFKFQSLLVQAYRKEGKKWGRLNTQASTHVKLAPDNVQSLFSHISVGDSLQRGMILAHQSVHFYSCPHCQKKILETESQLEKLKYCGGKLDSEEKSHDISVKFIVSDSFGSDKKHNKHATGSGQSWSCSPPF